MTNIKVCRHCGKSLGNTKFYKKQQRQNGYWYYYQCKKPLCMGVTAINYVEGKAIPLDLEFLAASEKVSRRFGEA